MGKDGGYLVVRQINPKKGEFNNRNWNDRPWYYIGVVEHEVKLMCACKMRKLNTIEQDIQSRVPAPVIVSLDQPVKVRSRRFAACFLVGQCSRCEKVYWGRLKGLIRYENRY